MRLVSEDAESSWLGLLDSGSSRVVFQASADLFLKFYAAHHHFVGHAPSLSKDTRKPKAEREQSSSDILC